MKDLDLEIIPDRLESLNVHVKITITDKRSFQNKRIDKGFYAFIFQH